MKEAKKNYQASIAAHYDRAHLSAEIFDALEKAGKSIDSYRDATGFDQFHMRGVEATRELAALAGLGPGQHVLDLGCGLGGASRLLAAEFGCRVTGIDLAPGFIETATRLTQAAGLQGQVAFHQGDLTDLPFEDEQFDVAWSQHTLMNIQEKSELFRQIARVLKPGGRFACYEIMAGPQTPVYYPVQWAGDASIDFLLPADRFRLLLAEAGFEMVQWQEVSVLCREWFQQVVTKMDRRPAHGPAPLGLNLVIGPSAAEKARNTLRNLEEERIRVVYGVARNKPPKEKQGLKIYFAGAIRGGRGDAALYHEMIRFLGAFGTVLTEHVGDTELTEAGDDGPDDRAIHDRDMAWLRACDLVVAEVTLPSLGVGYELGAACALGKPVLVLYRPQTGKRLSAMIAGSHGIVTAEYATIAQAKEVIRGFIVNAGRAMTADVHGVDP